MRFLTKEGRMRKRHELLTAKYSDWHKWFAWYPVLIFWPRIEYVWLEFIERKFEVYPIVDRLDKTFFHYHVHYRERRNAKTKNS
jgi:hypothetical protein